MCQACVATYMTGKDEVTPEEWAAIEWPASTPEMERLTAAVQRLYGFETCAVGGPLHIVTDDYNLEDSSLDFCERELGGHRSIDEAEPEDKQAIVDTGQEIIDLMRSMSLQERAVALGRTNGMVPA